MQYNLMVLQRYKKKILKIVNKDSLINISINKNQNYAIQFDGVAEIQEKNTENAKYSYNLSSKSVKILGTDNNPKLDLFLNQILR